VPGAEQAAHAAPVSAFILTWNPRRYPIAEADYEARRLSTVRGVPVTGKWSTGQNRRHIHPGDTLYWLRQGPDRRGLIGSGHAISEIFPDVHYERPGQVAHYVEHAFDVILPVDDRLETELLLQAVPGVVWNFLQGSGYRVPAASEELLTRVWREHLRSLND
jgi:hypothetical protein